MVPLPIFVWTRIRLDFDIVQTTIHHNGCCCRSQHYSSWALKVYTIGVTSMAGEGTASPASTSSSVAPETQSAYLSALIKGAGPSGLASAVALAQNGFKVRVVEKRPERPLGQGRQNMVAIRPEGLRRLDELGALPYLLASRDEKGNNERFTRITEAATKSELDGSVWVWDMKRYPPAEPTSFLEQNDIPYKVPKSLSSQYPSSFVTIGDVEDALRQAALKVGVELMYDATITVTPNENVDKFSASIVHSSEPPISLETPSLIVLASGKSDPAIPAQLSFARRNGVLLEVSNLPDLNSSENPRALQLSETADHEMETQFFSVFGIRYLSESSNVGILDHVVRKYRSTPETEIFQPVIEIQMNHAQSSHMLLHLPRSKTPFEANSPELEEYVLSRLNARLTPKVPFRSIQQLKNLGMISWGDPLQPITVETSTAPQFAYGTNVILVGDAAISCSPSSGIGADIGVTIDSKSVEILAKGLARVSHEPGGKANQDSVTKLLDEYNMRKAESAIMWSQGSRIFYVMQQQAEEILNRMDMEEQANGSAKTAAPSAAELSDVSMR